MMVIRSDQVFDGIDPKLLASFKIYHAKYPKVWHLFWKYCKEMQSHGRKRYSAWAIINRIRWDHDVAHTEQFKIRNEYIALYSRMMIYNCPEFKDFFLLKKMKLNTQFEDPTRTEEDLQIA